MKHTKFLSLILAICTILTTVIIMPVSSLAASGSIKLTVLGKSNTTVSLTWETSYNYSEYEIYRGTTADNLKKIKTVSSKKYNDKKLKFGKKYYYKVVGIEGTVTKSSSSKKIVVMESVTPYMSQSESTHITVEWSYKNSSAKKIDGFYVYRAGSDGKYKKIGTLKADAQIYKYDGRRYYTFFDTSSKKVNKTYKYKVVAYKSKLKANASPVEYTYAQQLTMTTNTKTVKVEWKKDSSAKYYNLVIIKYKLKSDADYKFVSEKIVKVSSSKTSYTIKKADSAHYAYYVTLVTYDKNSQPKEETAEEFSYSAASLMNGKASSKSVTSYKVMNTRTKKTTTAWSETLSSSEIKTFKSFEKLHFQSGMTKIEKALYVWEWINRNVAYDYDYDVSGKYGYVQCIFKYKQGQCLQYNGAFVKYLCYLGYEARIIEGYRVNNTNHFWGEIKINGKYFCMETGNFDSYGSWSFFCSRYGDCDASNYTKNGKKL